MTQPIDRISPALERVIERFGGLVRRIGARHGLPGADVDELVQEVRIRMWRSLADGEKIAGAPASYVYQTARSAAVDLIRRRRPGREEPLESLTGASAALVASRVARPDAMVESAQALAVVAQAIEELPDARRPVVRMYLAGYDRHEIAELLGWSEAKTRNLLYRGLSDLRAALERRGVHRVTA